PAVHGDINTVFDHAVDDPDVFKGNAVRAARMPVGGKFGIEGHAHATDAIVGGHYQPRHRRAMVVFFAGRGGASALAGVPGNFLPVVADEVGVLFVDAVVLHAHQHAFA